MSDTRALLNRIAEFRRRIEAMPRLVPPELPLGSKPTGRTPEEQLQQKVEAGSRTQAILEYSLRQLNNAEQPLPATLTNRARRLLVETQGLVARLKAFADDPLLAGPPAQTDGTVPEADVAAVHFRESAALVEAATRYALALPESPGEQMRLCEGLEGMIDAAHRRVALLATLLERRRLDAIRIDALARFLSELSHTSNRLDPTPILALASDLITTESATPLRFLHVEPTSDTSYLGGAKYPAPARFVAAHSLNCAAVLIRILRGDPEWRDQLQAVVVAALLHDAGMMFVDPGLLAAKEPLNLEEQRLIEKHARRGADLIHERLPTFADLADAIGTHHERADGTGYPNGLMMGKLSPLAHMLAAVDVYVAMCSPRPHRPAYDPRTAMTDTLLLADRGRLDRYAAEKLLVLGFYPAGTVVELSDGSTAVVIRHRDPRTAPHLAARPLLSLLADAGGRPLPTPRTVDLAETDLGIVVRALDSTDRLKRLGRHYPEWA